MRQTANNRVQNANICCIYRLKLLFCIALYHNGWGRSQADADAERIVTPDDTVTGGAG
jgi:hypothetical protein